MILLDLESLRPFDTAATHLNFRGATIMTYFENPGMWMYHCHIPQHAENGMMAELTVVASP